MFPARRRRVNRRHYSARNAIIGSTRAARLAGMSVAVARAGRQSGTETRASGSLWGLRRVALEPVDVEPVLRRIDGTVRVERDLGRLLSDVADGAVIEQVGAENDQRAGLILKVPPICQLSDALGEAIATHVNLNSMQRRRGAED
jgi:hypothetical protein